MTRAIQIYHTNETEHHGIGDEYVVLDDNTILGPDATMGEIYRYAQREYGRCQSKVYIDTKKVAKHIGWFFVKREPYQDVDETYLHGTWISVGEYVPTVPEHLVYGC